MGWKRGGAAELGGLVPQILEQLDSCAEQQQHSLLQVFNYAALNPGSLKQTCQCYARHQMVLFGIEHVKDWAEVQVPSTGAEVRQTRLETANL